MYYAKIYDTNKIPRAWAEGSSVQEVVENAVNVAVEYALGRPDTPPYTIAIDVINVDAYER